MQLYLKVILTFDLVSKKISEDLLIHVFIAVSEHNLK